MPITIIRSCEEEEARQMLEDHTLDPFLQQWHLQYPGEDRLTMIRRVIKTTGCGLHEAKQVVDQGGQVVRFAIGDRFLIRYAGDRPLLFRKRGAEWVLVTEDRTRTALDDLALWITAAPERPGRFRFKNYGEF